MTLDGVTLCMSPQHRLKSDYNANMKKKKKKKKKSVKEQHTQSYVWPRPAACCNRAIEHHQKRASDMEHCVTSVHAIDQDWWLSSQALKVLVIFNIQLRLKMVVIIVHREETQILEYMLSEHLNGQFPDRLRKLSQLKVTGGHEAWSEGLLSRFSNCHTPVLWLDHVKLDNLHTMRCHQHTIHM